jgi:hypothetical protein
MNNKFLKKLVWKLSPEYKKVDDIEVSFSLITDSGYEIFIVPEEVKLYKTFYTSSEYFPGEEIRFDKKIKDQLNKRANQILTEYQKKKRVGVNRGKIDTGKYIVKCTWGIKPITKEMTFEEYLNYKTIERGKK